MLTVIIVFGIYGHLGSGVLGGLLFSPILQRRIRHLDEEYYSTRPDMMKALLCGFFTLFVVIHVLADTERQIRRNRRNSQQR